MQQLKQRLRTRSLSFVAASSVWMIAPNGGGAGGPPTTPGTP